MHPISFLSYLGIASQTRWSHLTAADIDAIPECLGFVCRRFRDSLPGLLDGILDTFRQIQRPICISVTPRFVSPDE